MRGMLLQGHRRGQCIVRLLMASLFHVVEGRCSGHELHVTASIAEGYASITASEGLSWEGLSKRDFYAYLASLRGDSRAQAKRTFLEWYYAEKP